MRRKLRPRVAKFAHFSVRRAQKMHAKRACALPAIGVQLNENELETGATSLVGPEEEREPLEFRTFLNHHDVVMMITIEDY